MSVKIKLQYLQQIVERKKVVSVSAEICLGLYGVLLLVSGCTSPSTSTYTPTEATLKPSQSIEGEIFHSQPAIPSKTNSCNTIVNDPDGWVNVRSSPTTQAENILQTLDNGTVLGVVGERDGWLQITEPIEGWVASNRTTQVCEPVEENSAEAFYNHGIEKAQRGDDQGAINAFTQAIQLNPNFAEAYSNRGALQLENNRIKEAQADFDQAIRLDPGLSAAYYNRGVSNSLNAGISENRDNRIRGIRQDFTRAIQLQSDLAEAYFMRGKALPLEGLLYEPTFWQEKFRLTPELKAKKQDYAQAIRLNPYFSGSFRSEFSAPILISSNQHIQVGRSTRIQTASNNSEVSYIRGLAYLEIGNFTQAIQNLTQFIQLRPEDADAYYNRGFAHHRQRNYREAIADYSQAIQLNPSYIEAYYMRGLAQYDLKNYDESIQDATQAIGIDSKDANAYFIRGLAREAIADSGSMKDFQLAVSLFPCAIEGSCGLGGAALQGNPAAYYTRGQAFYKRGDRRAAIFYLRKSAELFFSQGNNKRYQEVQRQIQLLRR